MLSTLQHQSHQAHFADIRRQASERPRIRRERDRAQATSSVSSSGAAWFGSLRAARSS
jgi:hypothetical protein